MKATFFQRAGAYLLDTIIISLIFSLICLGLGNKTSSEELLMAELDNQLMEGTITIEEYADEYTEVIYDVQKETIIESVISVVLTIGYFVVFQYMNKGQTIGKKILSIRVVDKEKKQPISILKGLLRSFLIMSILSATLAIILIYIVNKDVYFASYAIFLGIEAIFTLVTVIMVLYKKDSRGLHDMMANTIVVKEGTK